MANTEDCDLVGRLNGLAYTMCRDGPLPDVDRSTHELGLQKLRHGLQ